MKVLFLTLGDERLASSRVRGWALAGALDRLTGWSTRCVVGPRIASLLPALVARRWDVIVLQKWVPPALLLRLIRARSHALIFECDDAIYFQDERGARDAARRLPSMLRSIDGVTTTTRAIADDLRSLGGPQSVLVFPGPAPSVDGVRIERSPRKDVLWLGSPATERYLELLRTDEPSAPVIRAVGATTSRPEGPPIVAVPWSIETATLEASIATVGIFVQPDGEWERRKAAYKVVEYVANGVVPVCTRSSASIDLLGDDYEFFFETSDWVGVANRALALDGPTRRGLIERLRNDMRRLSVDQVALRWADWSGSLR